MNKNFKSILKYTTIFLIGLFLILIFINNSNITSNAVTPKYPQNQNYEDNDIFKDNNMRSAQIGDIEDITVTKTETITSEFNAIGEIVKSTTSVLIELVNNNTDSVIIDFYDRVEEGNEITPSEETSTPGMTKEHGLLILNWSNLEIAAQDTVILEYLVDQNKTLPVDINIIYLVDGVPVVPEEIEGGAFELYVPLYSNLTISLKLIPNTQGLFVTTDTVTPISIAMVTVSLPSDIMGEPIYSTPPIMSTGISGINQIVFASLIGEEPTTINMTAQMIEAGGWGIIELEPLGVEVIRSPEMFNTLIGAINALLGGVTVLEGYWAYLTIESMIDQISILSPLLELLMDILVTDFSVFNTIFNSLIHFEGFTITELLESIFTEPSLIRNLMAIENIRGILNTSSLTGYPGGEDIILNELDYIQNSTVQAIGSQMLALLGSPVEIELYNFSLAVNNTWDSSQFQGNITAMVVSNDLDRDGISEMIIAYNWTRNSNIYTNISIFENIGNNSFVSIWNSTPLNGSVAHNCVGTGDFDQDNNRELFLGITNNDGIGNLTIFEFTVPGDISSYDIYNVTFQNGGISALLVEDGLNLDKDTDEEFILGLDNGSIYIINGSWNAGLLSWDKYNITIDGACRFLAHGDTDQDTREEILCSNGTQLSLFENTSLGFMPLKNITNYNLDLIVGDSDANDKLEILTCNDTWINLFKPNITTRVINNDTDPTQTIIIRTLEGYNLAWTKNTSSTISNATNITNLVIEDFNLDGINEIVTATENGSIFFYESIGNNKYSRILEYTLNTTTYGIKRLSIGDVDNDGHSDIIVMGKDDKIHVILKPFEIYDLNVRIYANLTETEGTQTQLYVEIELKNFLITYPFPRLENLTYVYIGAGPTIWEYLINVVEVINSTDNYHASVSQEISPETANPLSGVIGVWNSSEFNFITGQPYDGAINYFDPGLPQDKGTFEGNNITFKIPIGHPIELVVNYSYHLFSDPIFGINFTTIPPINYSYPGYNSTLPAIYPFIAHLFDMRTSPLIRIIGNLTTSLSKQFLILNSTISEDIGLYKPFIFESKFSLISILNLFSELLGLTTSPFDAGQQFELTLPSDFPIDIDLLSGFGNFQFISNLKIFTDPRIHSRFVTNVSLPGDFAFLDQAMDFLSLQSFLGLGDSQLFDNYTQYSDFPRGLNIRPILIEDVNNDGFNDTIFGINGFYPTYEIRALNGINQELLWDFQVDGPIINMSFDGNDRLNIMALNIENSWLMKNETQNSTIFTENILENQTSIDNRTIKVDFDISDYPGEGVFHVWDSSEFNFTNNTPLPLATDYYYINGSFEGKTVHLGLVLPSNQTDVVVNYTKKSDTMVTVDHIVKSVVGVWNVSSQKGQNYYPGGSIDGNNITLGTDLPTPNSTVYVKYHYYSNASSFIYIINSTTGELEDSRENILNNTRYFNGTSYIPHVYIGPDLGIIQTPQIINCSNALNPNNYILLIFTESSIYAINGTLEATPDLNLVFNNTAHQNEIWNISTVSLMTPSLIIDTDNDGNKELILIDMEGNIYSYDLLNGSLLWEEFQSSGMMSVFKANDIDNDGIKELVLGSVQGKINALKGNTGELLWSYEAHGEINDIFIEDIYGDGTKDIIAGAGNNKIHAINGSNGMMIWNYNISGDATSVAVADMNNTGQLDVISGSNENAIYYLNITDSSNITILWKHNITGQIPIFQFLRTSDSIILHYDLSDRLFEMVYSSMDVFVEDLMDIDTDIGFGMDSLLGMGMQGVDVDLASLTDVNLPDGIGLINLMMFQLQTLMSLDELGQVTSAQREFTGKPEVREVGDTPNVEIIQHNTTGVLNSTRFEILNNDSNDLIRLNYINVILNDDNGPIPMNQCTFYMWNGMQFINIMDNPYYNMTLKMLDLTYDNETGELKFRPFIQLEPYEQKNATVDWKGRVIYVEVNEYNGTLNITYWTDISIIHPEVTYNDIATSISLSYNFPVFIVQQLVIPQISLTPIEPTFLQELLSNPYFYAMILVFAAVIVEFTYLKRRENYHIQRLAHKNMAVWLKMREQLWRRLLKRGVLNKNQYNGLMGIKSRLLLEVRPRWYTDYCFDKIKQNRFLDMVFSTMLLLPFWRKIGQPNRLAKILNEMLASIFGPPWSLLKKIGGWIKRRIRKKPKKAEDKKEKKKKSMEEIKL